MAPKGTLKNLCQKFKSLISLQMPKTVIYLFKIIQIQDDQRPLCIRLIPIHKPLYLSFKGSSIIYICERIPGSGIFLSQLPLFLSINVFQIQKGIHIFRVPVLEYMEHQLHPVKLRPDIASETQFHGWNAFFIHLLHIAEI